MASYRFNDLDITLAKKGADRYTKASYPIRFGRYHEIKSPNYRFQFNLAGEIKFISGNSENWPHPAEWLKRTDANDWVFYSIAGYHQILDSLGEYYLPCLPYRTNSIWTYNPFGDSNIQKALSAGTQLLEYFRSAALTGLPSKLINFLKLAARKGPEVLHHKAARLHEIIGGQVSVLPPDTRHVDYEVIPLMIADGCLYQCSFCSIKSGQGYQRRSEGNILRQIRQLRVFYGANLRNYNALFLGNHDALAAGENLICLAAEKAYEIFEFANAHINPPALFLFGSVDSLLNSAAQLIERLDRSPYRTYINIGLESADSATLAQINKPLAISKIEEAFQKGIEINRAYPNLEVTANFLIGDCFTPDHYSALTELVRTRLDRFYSRGTIYLSPLNSSRNYRQVLQTFFKIKHQSRLPTYLYLIQRL